MPTADVNGQRLYYRDQGDGEPLIAIMGLGAEHIAWSPQVPHWSERYRVVTFDNRDVGRSSRCDDAYEAADMAADVLALADELGIDDFHLVGMSLGGTIAQQAALAAPERTRTLTLIATFAGAAREVTEMRLRVWEREVRSRTPEEMLESLMLLTLSERFFATPGAIDFIKNLAAQNPNPQDGEAFLRQARAAGRHDVRDRIGTLTMPVHVIGGDQDILIPLFKQRELAELIPGAELTVIEGAAHSMNIERGDELARAVRGFIDRH